ncbi:MAG: universal stress protein [Sphingobacterium sp.]|jgi:nucleotide-binding universal stress UspA family protein|nr:universal stress protein [Sphingobacterium sp.]
MEPLKKILILIDETPLSEAVVKFGYAIAGQLRAEIALLHVENSREYRMDMYMLTDATESMKIFKNSRQFLENLCYRFSGGIETKIFILEGRVKDSILSTVKEWNAQLIIAGSHEHTGFMSLFNQNLSEDILHSSSIPVLIVPEIKGKRQ